MRIFSRAQFRVLCLAMVPVLALAAQTPLEAAKAAYEKGDYTKAISILQSEATKDPQNGEVQLLLVKAYLETKQVDAAVSSAEKAVAIAPNNSEYHQWLGQAYGEKASHASMFSAYPLARKTQKEFETAVQLDAHNFDAAQDLVEYDCTAPEVEFSKALDSHPKSADRIYEIGDYFVEHAKPEKLLEVAAQGEALNASDPRPKYYRAVAWILTSEKLPDADKLLREYIQVTPLRSTYPKPWEAHYWLGRLQEQEKNNSAARTEYEAALKQNPRCKLAQEALKQLGNK